MSSVRLALAACPRDPAVWLLNLDTGESLPVPTPLNNGGAFDRDVAVGSPPRSSIRSAGTPTVAI
jgi:hypothetical protein